jgi:YD repeat-containing protein
VRWDWYSDEAFDPRPFWFERHWYRPGEPLTDRAAGDRAAVRYGFDDEGRPVAMEDSAGHRTITWTYDGDAAEATRVKPDGTWVYTHRWRYDGDRLVSHESRATGGTGREEYTYAEGLVVRIETWHDDQLFTTVTIGYGPDGELARIESTAVRGSRPVEVLYRRPPAGETLATLAATVSDLLTERIPLVVAAAEVDEPAYCVTLSYGDAASFPQIGVGLAADREEFEPFNPAEFEYFELEWDEQADDELLAATALLDQELGLAGEQDRIRELLIGVAQRLNGLDWNEILPVTDDFVVCPVDDEGADVEENLSAVTPAPAARPAS